MFQEYAGFRVLRAFLDEPGREIHVRDAAKVSKVSPGSAKKYLDTFYKENLLLRRKHANLLLYRGNLENPAFRQMKVAHSIQNLLKCGLVDYLVSNLSPSSITLFGSIARGEDDAKSDVDLFIIAKRREVDLTKFERKLNRKINLITYDSRTWEKKAKGDKPFYDDVTLEGISLHGELPVI